MHALALREVVGRVYVAHACAMFIPATKEMNEHTYHVVRQLTQKAKEQ